MTEEKFDAELDPYDRDDNYPYDYAWVHEERGRLWPLVLGVTLALLAIAAWMVEERYTKPPKVQSAPTYQYATAIMSKPFGWWTGQIDEVEYKPYVSDEIEILNDYAVYIKKPCSGQFQRYLRIDTGDRDPGGIQFPISMKEFDRQWINICFSEDQSGAKRLRFRHKDGIYFVPFRNQMVWMFYDEAKVA